MPSFVGSGRTVRFSGGASGPVTLIHDQFTDADGTNLTAHTIAPTNVPATVWEVLSGTWDIQSNRAKLVAAASTQVAVADAGVADCSVEAACTTPAAGDYDMGVTFRTVDDNNKWNAMFYSIGGTEKTQLWETTTGNGTERGGAVWATDNNTTYAVKVVLSGNNITVTYDGGQTINYTSTVRNAATKHGMGGYLCTALFDEFKVTP